MPLIVCDYTPSISLEGGKMITNIDIGDAHGGRGRGGGGGAEEEEAH